MQIDTSDMSLDSLLALARAIDERDPHTRQHSDQVSRYAVQIAQALNLDESFRQSVRLAALLHDVGMIGAPDWVLVKSCPLSGDEQQLIRRHPAFGADLLGRLKTCHAEANWIRHHHERWDGTGYPDGLAGEQIPLGARVIQVADCMDAMLMQRAYKSAYPVEKMLNELVRCAGTQFDAKIAAAAIRWASMNRKELVCSQRAAPPPN